VQEIFKTDPVKTFAHNQIGCPRMKMEDAKGCVF